VVDKIYFREGTLLKTNDVMAELDPTEFQLAVDDAKAMVDAAEARLAAMDAGGRPEERARAAADVDSAEAVALSMSKDHERLLQLFAKGGISRQALDASRREADVAQSKLTAIRKTLEMVRDGPRLEDKLACRADFERARAALTIAKLHLSYTKVLAPFDGTVGQRLVDEGAHVMGGTSPQATALAVVSSIRVLRALLDIPESEIPFVRLGLPARLTVQTAPGHIFPGRVANVFPYVEPKTRSGKLEVEVPNWPPKILLPGMFVKASVSCANRPATMAVDLLAGHNPGTELAVRSSREPRPPGGGLPSAVSTEATSAVTAELSPAARGNRP
jgi:multidrug resistance efflux pump